MFRTLSRKFFPSFLDRILKKTARKKGKTVLIGWNRGLGDIALGLYAIVHRIYQFLPDARVTVATRENLAQGFSMLENIDLLVMPHWKRGVFSPFEETLKQKFDLVIEQPSPTDWVSWQHGKLIPRLKWNPLHSPRYQKFGLSKKCVYVAVQVHAETSYGLWRNWPLSHWHALFSLLESKGIKVVLLGYDQKETFPHSNLVDLRGKTDLFDLLSLVQFCFYGLVLPDSGISSMSYYLDERFFLRHVTLWADPRHGILKQNVPSPNPDLFHTPLIAKTKNLSQIQPEQVVSALFPTEGLGAILLAAGQGTRLECKGAKGLFSIHGKTLFEWILEKAPKNRPIAIMTSSINHDEIVHFFERHGNFGLSLFFFQQEMTPLFDLEKKPLPTLVPSGNGSVFRSFCNAGLIEKFQGVHSLSVSSIDNPLTDLFEPGLFASLQKHRAEVAIQCIEKTEEDPPMGMVVEEGGQTKIIEYLSLDPKGNYRYAYSGQMAFEFSFFCRMQEIDLPFYWVQKKVDGQLAFKKEQFLFDVLPLACNVETFLVERDTHYAPIKSQKNLERVEALLRKKR